jgi:hypothetical protein
VSRFVFSHGENTDTVVRFSEEEGRRGCLGSGGPSAPSAI